jgi:hypothetical protein
VETLARGFKEIEMPALKELTDAQLFVRHVEAASRVSQLAEFVRVAANEGPSALAELGKVRAESARRAGHKYDAAGMEANCENEAVVRNVTTVYATTVRKLSAID